MKRVTVSFVGFVLLMCVCSCSVTAPCENTALISAVPSETAPETTANTSAPQLYTVNPAEDLGAARPSGSVSEETSINNTVSNTHIPEDTVSLMNWTMEKKDWFIWE